MDISTLRKNQLQIDERIRT